MPQSRPAVIAHRGASGYLPEHTLAAKALAHGMGADFLEQDVVATRDGELLVFHDLTLDAMTDVAQRLPGRGRADGLHYVVDFSLEEVRTLTVRERRNPDTGQLRFPGRFPDGGGGFRIHTLDEELGFVRALNRSTGREAGIYPEIKEPEWHRRHGIDLGAAILECLDRHGYGSPGAPAFVQCFDAGELRRVRKELGCRLPLVQLLEGQGSGGSVPTPGELAGVREYADGIGPSISLITPAGPAAPGTGLIAAAHDAGLLVHPYTFRRDELPRGFGDFEVLLDVFLRGLGADGVFTDFPDLVRRYLDEAGTVST
jgi:glycerophosphoryl diester phosphodiesterase